MVKRSAAGRAMRSALRQLGIATDLVTRRRLNALRLPNLCRESRRSLRLGGEWKAESVPEAGSPTGTDRRLR